MIQKKIMLKNLKINPLVHEKNLSFVFYQNKKALVSGLNGSLVNFVRDNNCFLFSNFCKNNAANLFKLIKDQCEILFYQKYTFFGKVHMIGLGYKNFVLDNRLYLLVGDCNYIIFNIPKCIKIFCKKNQIYMLSTSQIELFNFVSNLKRVKKPNFYKGKGVLEFRNFKFTKLKVGKKQRFM